MEFLDTMVRPSINDMGAGIKGIPEAVPFKGNQLGGCTRTAGLKHPTLISTPACDCCGALRRPVLD